MLLAGGAFEVGITTSLYDLNLLSGAIAGARIVGGAFGMLLGLNIAAVVGIKEYIVPIGSRKDLEKYNRSLTNASLKYHPKWISYPPSQSELSSFYDLLLTLPPIGSKVPELKRGGPVKGALPPTATAEAQVDQILEKIKKKKQGEQYVVQFTVQGRLGDGFKHAALAMLIASPYEHDWDTPYFEAPWGKCAPLVHDGGNVRTDLNPRWANIGGRTDFLQRVGLVYEPDVKELEALTPEQRSHLSIDRLARARDEQIERQRLLIEALFYHRSALTRHAFEAGTGLPEMPLVRSRQLGQEWITLEGKVDRLLWDYEIDNALRVRWFNPDLRESEEWSGYGPRYEADYEPIQEQLMKVEQTRLKHPEMIRRAKKIMVETIDSIDQVIGLKSAALWE